MTRKDPTTQQRERLLKGNAGVCCVCKKPGLGIHLHHIDGDSSNTVDENLAVLCVKDSICCIYINPKQPSLAITLFLNHEVIYQGALHLCGNSLHYGCSNFEESFPISKRPSIRTQVTRVIQEVIDIWKPGRLFVGTGKHEAPDLIEDFKLPKCWEKIKEKQIDWQCESASSNCSHF